MRKAKQGRFQPIDATDMAQSAERSMSVYKHHGSPYYHYDFQCRGRRFHGSTECKDRRQAEAVERREREKAKAVSRSNRDLPHTYGEAAARFWNEVGQHNATADDTRRNL